MTFERVTVNPAVATGKPCIRSETFGSPCPGSSACSPPENPASRSSAPILT